MIYKVKIGQVYGSNRNVIKDADFADEDKQELAAIIADYINTFKHIPVCSFDEIRESSDKSIGFSIEDSDVYFVTNVYIIGSVIHIDLIA